MEACLAMRHFLYGAVHPSIADTEQILCQIKRDENKLAEAERHCRVALSVGLSWYGPDDHEIGSAMRALGVVLTREKKLQEARPILERALVLQKEGQDPEGVFVATSSLAENELASGEVAAAETHFNWSLAAARKLYGGDNSLNVGTSLFYLSEVAFEQHNYGLAEDRARQALSILLNVQGRDGSRTALAHVQLGHCLLPQKNYPEAKRESQLGYNMLMKQPGLPSKFLQMAAKDMVEEERNLSSR